MNYIKQLSGKIYNYILSFKPNKDDIWNKPMLTHINELCKNDNYNSSFIELDNNTCIGLDSNGILVTLFPRNNDEEQEYIKFICRLVQDSHVLYGRKKITIRVGMDNKFILNSYNYNLIGQIKQYLENIKNFNLVLLTTNEKLLDKV